MLMLDTVQLIIALSIGAIVLAGAVFVIQDYRAQKRRASEMTMRKYQQAEQSLRTRMGQRERELV